MNRQRITAMSLIVLAVLVLGGWYIANQSTPEPEQASDQTGTATSSTSDNTSASTQTLVYACMQNAMITAEYKTEGSSSVDPSAPAATLGSVALQLSDGRKMTLSRISSPDGILYKNADGSVVFMRQGHGVTFTEQGRQTFMGCIEVAKDPGGLAQTYANGSQGFSIRYPDGYRVDEPYRYDQLGPGKEIGGVRFMIPSAFASGTNIGTDSYFSVEEIPQSQTCSAALFLDRPGSVQTITEGDTTYSVASSTGAAAGNRYEETVYAIPGTNPCMAVRYFIHYGVIENYPSGSVREFDSQALKNEFDNMRGTLILLQ